MEFYIAKVANYLLEPIYILSFFLLILIFLLLFTNQKKLITHDTNMNVMAVFAEKFHLLNHFILVFLQLLNKATKNTIHQAILQVHGNFSHSVNAVQLNTEYRI